MDYEFQILDNAFLVHKPGIKTLHKDPARAAIAARTNSLIKKEILPQLKVLYGVRKGCAVWRLLHLYAAHTRYVFVENGDGQPTKTNTNC